MWWWRRLHDVFAFQNDLNMHHEVRMLAKTDWTFKCSHVCAWKSEAQLLASSSFNSSSGFYVGILSRRNSCFARPKTSAPDGTSWVTTDPAAMTASLPTLTGAAIVDLAPMNVLSSISILFLPGPSCRTTVPAPILVPGPTWINRTLHIPMILHFSQSLRPAWFLSAKCLMNSHTSAVADPCHMLKRPDSSEALVR